MSAFNTANILDLIDLVGEEEVENRLYVNSWGRAQERNLTAKELRRAAAPLLLGAGGTMEYSVAEAGEVANAETNAF